MHVEKQISLYVNPVQFVIVVGIIPLNISSGKNLDLRFRDAQFLNCFLRFKVGCGEFDGLYRFYWRLKVSHQDPLSIAAISSLRHCTGDRMTEPRIQEPRILSRGLSMFNVLRSGNHNDVIIVAFLVHLRQHDLGFPPRNYSTYARFSEL